MKTGWEKLGIARTLAKNFVFQLFANMILKFSNFFIIIFLTFLLSPKDFGLYAWVVSIAMLLEVFAELGTSSSLIRFLSESTAKKDNAASAFYFKYLFKRKVLGVFFISILIMVFADAISVFVFNKPYLAFPMRFSLAILIAYTLFSFLQNTFLALKENKYIFYSNLLSQGLLKIALMISLVLFLNSFFGALVGYAVSLALACLYFLVVLRKKFSFLFVKEKKIDSKRIREYANYCFFSGFALIVLVNIDLMMISALLAIENVGFYSIAMSLLTAFSTIFPILVIFPIFSELAVKSKENFASVFDLFFKYLLFLLIPISVGLFFISTPLVHVLYPSAYESVVSRLLAALSPIVLLNGLYSFLVIIYGALERADLGAKVTGIAVLIDIVANFFFINWFGIIGAAIATLIAYCVICFSMLLFLKPVVGIKINPMHFVKPVLASIVMGVCLMAVGNWFVFLGSLPKLLLLMGIGLASYFGTQIALRGIDWKEIIFLKNRILHP